MANNAQKSRNLTVLGLETEFNGVLSFTDDLVITGKFDGTIRATGMLEIDKHAVCTVDSITAESIIVSGKVTGTLTANDKIEMKAGSKIIGDIASSRLRIEDAVDFQGQVTMLDQTVDADIFSMPTSEFKEILAGSTENGKTGQNTKDIHQSLESE